MTLVAEKIRHLLARSAKAQEKHDCAGAYHALIQAVKAFGHAMGAGDLNFSEAGSLERQLRDRVIDVFDGCIGE